VKSSIYHSPTRFKNSNGVFERRFDGVAGWKAWHHSTAGTQRKRKRLGTPQTLRFLATQKTCGVSGQAGAGGPTLTAKEAPNQAQQGSL